jgi:hypothetical protein
VLVSADEADWTEDINGHPGTIDVFDVLRRRALGSVRTGAIPR